LIARPKRGANSIIRFCSLSLGVILCLLGTPASFAGTPTSTTITNSAELANSTVTGQDYVVQWVVTPLGTGTPTGNVVVMANGSSACSAPVGTGQCVITPTAAGPYQIVVQYGGDSEFDPSASAPASHQVDPASTETTITNEAELSTPTAVGQPFTVKWQVTALSPGGGTPTGPIQVILNSSIACTALAEDGQCQITPSAAGPVFIQVQFLGSSDYAPSSSAPATHVVNRAATSIAITNEAQLATPSPALSPYDVTWSISLNPSPSRPSLRASPPERFLVEPTGNVTVQVDDVAACMAPAAAGQCDVMPTEPGMFELKASYEGDANYEPSTSATVMHTVSDATGVDAQPVTAFALLPPWPSPVHRVAFVAIDLPERSEVTLDLYDLGGRVVRSILQHELLPAGRSVRSWRPEGLPSGVYLLRARAGAHAGVRKLVWLGD
jgi:hypothetical protein